MTTAEASAQALFDEHEPALRRLARRFVGDDERAKEIVQDTFMRFWERREHVAGRLPQWLFTVCRNRAIDVARRERVRHPSGDAGVPLAPAASAGTRLDIARAARAVRGLPARQRRIVEMRLGDGASYREIAAALGLSPSHVGTLMHDAIAALRDRLGETR